MANYDIQNASKLKKGLPTVLGSYVAVYKNMDELKEDIDKYNNINYSIIFVETSAYVIKKEDYNNNQVYLGVSANKELCVGNSTSFTTNMPEPVLKNIDQSKLVITGGMSAYLNNYTGIK